MGAFIIQIECPDCNGRWTQPMVADNIINGDWDTLPDIQGTRCDHGCGAKLTITPSQDGDTPKIIVKSDSGKMIETVQDLGIHG